MSGVKLTNFSFGKPKRLSIGVIALLALTACDENGEFKLGSPAKKSDQAATGETDKKGKVIERDVEAPDVFSANEAALWDGRPSLGGIWIAHPDVDTPQRVKIVNQTNNKSVVAALFRRERNNPGPKLQLSSDAAEELGILAGSPTKVNVVALKREEIVLEPPAPEVAAVPEPVKVEAGKKLDAPAKVKAPSKIKQKPLDPIAAASAAIEASPATPPKNADKKATDAAAEQLPEVPAPFVTPYAQVGIFSDEAEAKKVQRKLRWSGAKPSIKTGDDNGQPFWRVIIGPAESQEKLDKLMKRAKRAGFNDVTPVAN